MLDLSDSPSAKASGMSKSLHVLAMVKGEERYVFLYDPQSIDQLIDQLGKYASDPELDFTWYDAAILAEKARGSKTGLKGPHAKHRWSKYASDK